MFRWKKKRREEKEGEKVKDGHVERFDKIT